MAKTRKQIEIRLKITAPAGMTAAQIRREVKTRINSVAPHYDAHGLDLPWQAEGADGYLKIKASDA